jgi:hypothetical protein
LIEKPDLSHLENTLHHLNYRWNLESLALWKGEKVPFEPYRIYEGFDGFISLKTLSIIDRIEEKEARNRLRHALIDHYLQRALLPHETEMRTWMRGASAHVNGRKIYFRDIINWCQKESNWEERQILQKETGPLCKFLKPFAVNYWNILLDILKNEIGYASYLEYCSDKKGIDYPLYYEMLKKCLEETDDVYFDAMEDWCRERFKRPLSSLTRFDAINILGLGEYDSLFPRKNLGELVLFFNKWELDVKNTPGLHLELGKEEGKSSQAICFILQVPEEVYVLMKPEGGWIDLETLWHELGHGLSAVFTSPALSITERDLATSQALSESFAFLLQNITLSKPFMEGYLGLNHHESQSLFYSKVLKDLSLFRRYAAKFISEYEMFQSGDISNGGIYASLMSRYTGFYYQPESHLFDLAPELYGLDYILGWIAEAVIEAYLTETLGPDWIFRKDAGNLLKKWWNQGNKNNIFGFFKKNQIGPFVVDILLNRWKKNLD